MRKCRNVHGQNKAISWHPMLTTYCMVAVSQHIQKQLHFELFAVFLCWLWWCWLKNTHGMKIHAKVMLNNSLFLSPVLSLMDRCHYLDRTEKRSNLQKRIYSSSGLRAWIIDNDLFLCTCFICRCPTLTKCIWGLGCKNTDLDIKRAFPHR